MGRIEAQDSKGASPTYAAHRDAGVSSWVAETPVGQVPRGFGVRRGGCELWVLWGEDRGVGVCPGEMPGSESRCKPLSTNSEMQELQLDFLITPFHQGISSSPRRTPPLPLSLELHQVSGGDAVALGAGKHAPSASFIHMGLL